MNKAINYYHHDKKNIFDTISIKNKLDDISIGAAPWLHKLESQTHIVPFMSPMSSLMQPVSMGATLQPRTIKVAPATSKTIVLRSYVSDPNSGIVIDTIISKINAEYLPLNTCTAYWLHREEVDIFFELHSLQTLKNFHFCNTHLMDSHIDSIWIHHQQ